MCFLQVFLAVFLLANAATAVFANSTPQDPKAKSECLVNASELPSGTPMVMCPTRSSPGSFCVCPKFSKEGDVVGYYAGTAR